MRTGGKIGNFFPSNKVKHLLHFKDEMNNADDETFMRQTGSDQYKELLMNLIKNKKNTGRTPMVDARITMKQNQSNEMLPNFDDEPIYGL